MLRAPQWMLRAPQWTLRASRTIFVSGAFLLVDVKGSTVDVKGSSVDVKGLMDRFRLGCFLLGVRKTIGGRVEFSGGKRSYSGLDVRVEPRVY
eukprot:1003320-Prorocentrum_minimum.AAC.1